MVEKIKVIKNWLRKSKHDFGMAGLALESGTEYTDSICFHCQQYVEKVLKAYLICIDIDFKKTHSLSYLLDLIAEREEVEDEVYKVSELLEDYAVGVRYPADNFEPTIEDSKDAFNGALIIKQLYEEKINSYIELATGNIVSEEK